MPIEEGQKSKMSLHSSGYDKSTERISIFIKKCKNLVCFELASIIKTCIKTMKKKHHINWKINLILKNTQGRPEGLTLYAKIDFNENPIGESQKILVTADHVPDLNFNATLSVNTNDQNSLDEIAYKPVIGT